MGNAFCAVLVTLVSYPLAPKSPAPVTLPHLQRLYRQLLLEAQQQGRQLLLAGDSAGANITLSIAIQGRKEDRNAPHASAILVICPAVDLSHDNPESHALSFKDSVLNIKSITDFANVWRADWNRKDPQISPLFADVSLLSSAITVHGILAELHVLSPDGKRFRDKCKEKGVAGQWLQWDKQMRCFPLVWHYGFPESKDALCWIVDVLLRQITSGHQDVNGLNTNEAAFVKKNRVQLSDT